MPMITNTNTVNPANTKHHHPHRQQHQTPTAHPTPNQGQNKSHSTSTTHENIGRYKYFQTRCDCQRTQAEQKSNPAPQDASDCLIGLKEPPLRWGREARRFPSLRQVRPARSVWRVSRRVPRNCQTLISATGSKPPAGQPCATNFPASNSGGGSKCAGMTADAKRCGASRPIA